MNTVLRVNSNNKDFQELIKLLDTELNSRYGIVQEELNKFNIIETIDTVVIGYIDNNPIGCGCFKIYDTNSIEIKRMIVKDDFRGTGIAKMILTELENWATEKGFFESILETGIKQPDAIRFYTKLGYSKIDNYGQYIGNRNSVCMSKELKK